MQVSRQESLPDYATIAAVLERCGLTQGPAEMQGFALGLLVAQAAEPLTIWQRELYSDFDPADVLATECRSMLDRLFASVFTQQPDAPLQLALLLPQDIVVDASRLAAVRDWCQGFLFGFGLGGSAASARLSEPGRELLRDIAEFTRLDTENVENTRENQAALIEIEEFLREGVMLIRDDLGTGRDAQ